VAAAVVGPVVLLATGPVAHAQRSVNSATFSNPVQLAGILLVAGTYEFAVAPDRRSVVVSDANRRVVTTLMVAPVSRARSGDVVVMRPGREGASPEIDAMYLDGGRNGFQIVRPANAPQR
jgi:hypothetical protein